MPTLESKTRLIFAKKTNKTMSKIAQAQLIQQLENRIEQHLKDTIYSLQNLPENVLLRAASNGGWSIAQCLEHLNTYGDYYLPQIKSGLEKAPKSSPDIHFESSWLGAYSIKMMEPTTGKKKFKAFKGHIPAEQLDGHAVVARFIQQQEELLSYVKQAKSVNLNNIRIPISITRLIRLKLGDVFQFIIAHDERHLQQAFRNLH